MRRDDEASVHGLTRSPARETGISRRRLLASAAGLAVSGLVSGCGISTVNPAAGDGIGPARLPSPDNPVSWPLAPDNRAIASGLSPERGATLQIFNWGYYINEKVVKAFCKRYDCGYQITTYDSMDDAIAKLGSGQLDFDVFVPTVPVLGQLVEAKLIRPLNHSYIPNIANTWADYHDPFYDRGWRYTVPYVVYTTGMAWRKDKVNLAPSWDMPWQGAPYKGKVALVNDYREAIGLALLRAGNDDINTTNTAQVQAAGRSLARLAELTDVQLNNTDYTDIPTGKTWIHQAWSGNMANSWQYLPKGTSIDVLGYWSPPSHRGPVNNDLFVNLRGGRNPVLAHLFINYMLGVDNALENYSYVGYMPPLTEVTPQRLIAEKLLPRQLVSTVVRPSYFRRGLYFLELPPAADAVWESTWNSFSKGL